MMNCIKRLWKKHLNASSQGGRMLLEMLGVLALSALLILVALKGFMYAQNKMTANRIMSDVSLAYMDASEQERPVGIYEVSFKPESGLPIETERQETASGKQTDLVIVDSVRPKVCKILQQMTQNSSFVLLEWSDEALDYIQFSGCAAEDQALVFAYGKDIGCTCPEHGTCRLSTGCVCDFGYELTRTGKCEEIICPEVKEVEDITEEYCCVSANGEWDGTCFCPEDYYFNGKQCVPGQGFCVYSYEGPTGNGYYANCAYSYQEPTGNGYYAECTYTFSETNGVATLTAGIRCPADQYCILKWTDTDCASTLPAEGAPTIYGRCATLSTTHSQCRQYEENAVPTLRQTENCPAGQYCILKWTDTDCANTVPAEGAPTIYGRCATLSTSYSQCRQHEENIVPTVRARHPCQGNQYCRLSWSSDTCQTLSAEGADLIYGVCLSLSQSSPLVCPVE